MKKVLLSLAVAAFLASCGGAETANVEGGESVDTTAVAPVVKDTVAVVEAPVVEDTTSAPVVEDTTATPVAEDTTATPAE